MFEFLTNDETGGPISEWSLVKNSVPTLVLLNHLHLYSYTEYKNTYMPPVQFIMQQNATLIKKTNFPKKSTCLS